MSLGGKLLKIGHNKMKVLVTGAHGMLGADVVKVFSGVSIDVVGYSKSELDITDITTVRSVITKELPTHIVNCAAYTAVDAAEDDRDKCSFINVSGVANLIAVCLEQNIKLIQISTDYVFDGSSESYDEYQPTMPLNYYGLTKAQAESSIKTNLVKYAIVRTSWLYGKSGKNFVETIRGLAKSKSELKIVNDQIGCPTYTVDFARALIEVLNRESGVYHISNTGECSWYEFALAIKALCRFECSIISCSSLAYAQKAKRPTHSVLHNTKLPENRNWQEALEEYINIV
jgi:dTDP-4-dehydrorhamnose reductase